MKILSGVISLLLLMLLLLPARCEEPDSNTFTSAAFGVTVRKPGSWRFGGVDEHKESLGLIRLKSAELEKLLRTRSEIPFVMIMKHPEGHDEISPVMKIAIRPLKELPGDDPKAIVARMAQGMKAVFRDFKITSAPKETKAGGLKAGHVRIEYTLEAGETAFPARSDIWAVPRGKYLFLIGAAALRSEPPDTQKEFDRILASLRIAPEKQD